MMKRKGLLVLLGLLLTCLFAFPGIAVSADEDIERLEGLIKAQQQQLEMLQKQVEQSKQTASDAQTQAKEAKSVAEEMKTANLDPVKKAVTSGSEKVKLTLSGQVHRAMNVVSDGDTTEAYFVDSDASNSKFRLVGTVKIDGDLTLGTRLELAVAPNESSDVSQDNAESGDFFDQRYADLSLASKRFGTIFLGKGDTASNNSAEVDLSGTDIVQYASIADIAGGMQFVESGNDTLTGISVSDAFKDFDGLSRKSRLRYDTPTYRGFKLATSWISDKRWDGSLWWSGKFSGLKAAAAGAVAYINTDRNGDDSDYQYDGAFSILHEETGLNFTLSAGVQEVDNQGDPSNVWGKVGWRTDLVSYGKTSFGIDYGSSDNLITDSDDGYSFGAAAVQQFNDYGAEVYAQFRVYSLDRNNDPNVQDINVFTIGSRVKF